MTTNQDYNKELLKDIQKEHHPTLDTFKIKRTYTDKDMIDFVSFVGENYVKNKSFYFMKFDKNKRVSIHDILEQFNSRV
jgi:hypothetical protein